MGLSQRTFSGLHHRDTVLRVADSLLEAADLRAQAFRDGKTSSIVRSAVDAETTGQLLKRLAEVALRGGQVAVRVHRRNVLVNRETHGASPP